MVTTNQKIKIAAIVVPSIIVLALGIGIPIWQERPIVEYSFSNPRVNYDVIKSDHDYYYFDIKMTNTGQTNGNVLLTVVGKNAQVSFDKKAWENQDQEWYLVHPNKSEKFGPIHVIPNMDSDTFALELMAKNVEKYTFQDLTPLTPVKLTYKLSDGRYMLID